MSSRRVVVTGAGCVTAIGNSVAEFRESLFAARSGIVPLVLPEGQKLNFANAAQVTGFDAASLLPSAVLLLTEHSAQFALVAAKQAVEESRLLDHCAPDDIAIVTGCCSAGREAEEPEMVKLYTRQGRVHPFTIPRVMANSGASQLSIMFGITGPAMTFSTACASSAHAIGHAFHLVRSGMVEAALAGGHEAPLTYGFLKAWEAMRVVSPTRCKPFSAHRDGMSLGEGAAILVLEEREHALARHATIYAEIAGFGMSSDAGHITQPHAAGPVAAMRMAMRDAELDAAAISYINAHGTGTEANDRVEAEAIREVFGPRVAEVPVSSTKALHGHTLGAAGAIEALATILTLREGHLPVSLGAEEPDPSLGLNIVQHSEQFATQAALSNSFAFGGLNASLLFRAAAG